MNFAVATTADLNHQGRSFAAQTLTVCEGLLMESEPIVQKAVGWALREACKSDDDAVFAFLNERKQRIHPRILREGAEKLPRSRQQQLRA